MNDFSASAIALPDVSIAEAIAVIDAAMARNRFKRWDARPPRGYPLSSNEWVAFILAPFGPAGSAASNAPSLPRGIVVLPNAPAEVFRYATWLSDALPDALVPAWKRFAGFTPVAKYFAAGKPIWRDGDDDDLEVGWHVPTAPPAATILPARRTLPESVAELTQLLGPVLRPRDGAPRQGERQISYLARRSALA